MIDAWLLPGGTARLEEAATNRFADPFDSAGDEHQPGDAGQQPTNFGAGALTVGVPEVRASKDANPRTVWQERVESSRFMIVACGACCYHDDSLSRPNNCLDRLWLHYSTH